MDAPLVKMSLAEFMAWENAQPDRHEFYRGKTFAMIDRGLHAGKRRSLVADRSDQGRCLVACQH